MEPFELLYDKDWQMVDVVARLEGYLQAVDGPHQLSLPKLLPPLMLRATLLMRALVGSCLRTLRLAARRLGRPQGEALGGRLHGGTESCRGSGRDGLQGGHNGEDSKQGCEESEARDHILWFMSSAVKLVKN